MVLAVGGNDINDASPGVIIPFAANMGASSNDSDDFSAAGAASIIATAGSIYPSVWTTWGSGAYVTATLALTPATTPTVTSDSITEITQTTATGDGNVTADGGSAILERGFVWDVNANPTVDTDSHNNTVGTTGAYQSSLTSLSQGTSYFSAAYAINAIGSVYGSDIQFSTNAPDASTDWYFILQ